MRNFEHAYNVLNKILIDNIPFNLAIKSSLKQEKKKIDNDFKTSITASVGCVLRHYYVFKEITSRKYGELEDEKFIYLSLGLANHLFSKRFDENDLNKYLAKESGISDLVEFINSFEDTKKLIPEDIEFGSKKYCSLRYNIPMWLVSMWQKNGGEFLSKKLFRSLINHSNTLVRVNTLNNSESEFVGKYNDFEIFEEELHLAKIKDEKLLKKHNAIYHQDALLIPASYSYMCKDLDLDPMRGIAIYCGDSNYLLDELFLRLGPIFKADYLCGSQKHFFEVKEDVKRYGLTNLAVYECEFSAILTCISKPVHTFFLCPKNTNLIGLIEKPDYFLSCKQENLDKYIKDEYQALLEASRQVEDGGNLVYFVPTFCKNETRSIINRFINENHGFSLVEQKQLFPFDKYETMLFYAILKKEK